jgi:predicted nucleic acid-binding protein
VSTPKSRLSLW